MNPSITIQKSYTNIKQQLGQTDIEVENNKVGYIEKSASICTGTTHTYYIIFYAGTILTNEAITIVIPLENRKSISVFFQAKRIAKNVILGALSGKALNESILEEDGIYIEYESSNDDHLRIHLTTVEPETLEEEAVEEEAVEVEAAFQDEISPTDIRVLFAYNDPSGKSQLGWLYFSSSNRPIIIWDDGHVDKNLSWDVVKEYGKAFNDSPYNKYGKIHQPKI